MSHITVPNLRRKPPRAAYALPTLFTAGNIFLGFLSMLRSLQGVMESTANPSVAAEHFKVAAISIGVAIVLDGLDGRIARLTHTTSEFGREMDSLSDVISFGIAPAILAYAWGVQFLNTDFSPAVHDHVLRAGKLITFLFLLCGSARLARFNVQINPVPKNPGRPNRKYFVGLPIPAAAGLVAAIVYFAEGVPLRGSMQTVSWLSLILALSFLMISMWRYYAFKDSSFLRPRSPVTLVVAGLMIFLIWNWTPPMLLAIASAYVSGGVFLRAGGLVRRLARRPDVSKPLEQPGV